MASGSGNSLKINQWVRRHRAELLLVGVAFILRCGLFLINLYANGWDIIPTVKGDDGYFELSANIVAGHGFSWDAVAPFHPNPLRPPVYLLFLALPLYLTGSYWVTAFCQLIVGSIIPLLGMLVSRSIVGTNGISRAVGWILAFEPYSLLLSFIFYTETVFTALFLAFLLFLFRYAQSPSSRLAVWTALFLGLATLVKPTVQYLPVVLPLLFIWRWHRRRSLVFVKHLAVFLITFIVVITPWIIRNYRTFGVAGISSQPAFNLMVYLVPSVRALENGTSFRTELDRWKIEQQFAEEEITLTTSRVFRERAAEELKNHPKGVLKSMTITVVTFFTHDGTLTVLQYSGIKPSVAVQGPAFLLLFKNPSAFLDLMRAVISSSAVLILVSRLAWICVSLLFFWGALLFLKRERTSLPAICALVLVAYFALTSAVGGLGVTGRHRFPVNTLFFTFAAYGLVAMIRPRIINRILARQHNQ